MLVEFLDGLFASAFAAGGAAVLAWMVVFGRLDLEGEGVEWGEWLFRAVGVVCTSAAFAWSVVSFWSVHPLLVMLAPAPVIGAVLVTSILTRRSKPPRGKSHRT